MKEARISMGGKWKTVLYGTVICLISLEAMLRVFGVVYLHYMGSANSGMKRQKKDFTILCVGDSYTTGIGAPKGKGYPSQLETLLNSNTAGVSFKVINRAEPATNSSLILADFDRFLESAQPNMVIILAGGANLWNAYGYSRSLHGKTLLSIITDLLYEIKLYKLVRLLWYNVGQKSQDQRDYKTSFQDRAQKDRQYYVAKAKQLSRACRLVEAREYFKKVIQLNPNDPQAYCALGIISDHKEALELFIKSIEVSKRTDPMLYAHFPPLFFNTDDLALKNKILKFLYAHKDRDQAAKDTIEMLLDKQWHAERLKKWILSDLRKMIDTCRRMKIKVIIQNYPAESLYSVINSFLNEFALKESIPLVDNAKVFRYLLEKGDNEYHYFVPDKHCNERGYKIMAENVYQKVMEEINAGKRKDN